MNLKSTSSLLAVLREVGTELFALAWRNRRGENMIFLFFQNRRNVHQVPFEYAEQLRQYSILCLKNVNVCTVRHKLRERTTIRKIRKVDIKKDHLPANLMISTSL